MEIFVAKQGFIHQPKEGQRVTVYRGDTVAEGHWLLDLNPGGFKPLEVKFDVEGGARDADKIAAVQKAAAEKVAAAEKAAGERIDAVKKEAAAKVAAAEKKLKEATKTGGKA